MIDSEIRTIRYENGEMQRYQILSGFAWNDLEFVQAPFTKETFEEIVRMYQAFVIPKHSFLYGAFVIFHLPDGVDSPFPSQTEDGVIFDRQIATCHGLEKMYREGRIRNMGDHLEIDDERIAAFISSLEKDGWLGIGYGDKKDVAFFPIGEDLGYLSHTEPTPQLICNSNFFMMDLFDHDSPYDLFGTPYGMIVKNGIVSQPPINNREALLVDMDGKVKIGRPTLSELSFEIQGIKLVPGENCSVYWRPDTRVTPKADGLDLIIVGDEVVAVHSGGGVRIPGAGFVLHTSKELEAIPSPVVYRGMENCLFGIQVGSSAVKDGVLIDHFESPFFDLKKDDVPYPPSLYPLDYARDRAPRMAICSDSDENPVIVWAEGCSKLFYDRGNESAGSSLLELAGFCHSIGLTNALNMDGGGSSEVFLSGKAEMHVSDRYPDNSDSERPVPMGLMVR